MFAPVRQMFVPPFSVDFTGATVLKVGSVGDPVVAGATVSFKRATIAEGCPWAAVDWGDGTPLDFYSPGTGRVVALSHKYATSGVFAIRITDTLSEFYPSGVSVFRVPSLDRLLQGLVFTPDFHGADLLTSVDSLGGRIGNRNLSIGLFANTMISSIPALYGFPELVAGSGTLCIPMACFCGCSKLTGVRSISGVKVIDIGAFKNCVSLASIAGFQAQDLRHIGASAFSGCTALASLEGIGDSALVRNGDESILGRSLGSGVSDVTIDSWADDLGFSDVDEVAKRRRIDCFNFPLGGYAFYGCTNLTDISGLKFRVEGGVSDGIVLPGTFCNCVSLSDVSALAGCSYGDVYMDAGNGYSTGVGAPCVRLLNDADAAILTDGSLTFAPGPLFSWTSGPVFSGSAVTDLYGLVASTTDVLVITKGEYANCSGLTSVSIPLVRRIGMGAFSGCSNLTNVTFTEMTRAQVQGLMDVDGLGTSAYPVNTFTHGAFGLPSGCAIHCTDGDIIVS